MGHWSPTVALGLQWALVAPTAPFGPGPLRGIGNHRVAGGSALGLAPSGLMADSLVIMILTCVCCSPSQHASKGHGCSLPKMGQLRPGDQHTRKMLLCKVACGKISKVTGDISTPQGAAPGGYDSVHGNAQKGAHSTSMGCLPIWERLYYPPPLLSTSP